METMTPQTPEPSAGPDWTTPRPIDATYWVVPGRLLVGEHPGSRSRAQSMERLRRFLEAGITCFIDLTEPDELPAYEMLLPFETPSGRRVEYLREPIPDHGVPADRETMDRILAMLDGALETGHCVYLHCRAGIGRSAMAAGCWLAERNPGGGEAALDGTRRLLAAVPCNRGCGSSVPETSEQARVRALLAAAAVGSEGPVARHAAKGPCSTLRQRRRQRLSLEQRVRGGWFGLALGDAIGATHAAAAAQRLAAGLDAAHGAHALSCREPGRVLAAAMRATRSSVTGAGSRTDTGRPRANPAKHTRRPTSRRRSPPSAGAACRWPVRTIRRTPPRRACRACSPPRCLQATIPSRPSHSPPSVRAPRTSRR